MLLRRMLMLQPAFALRLVSGGFPGISGSIQARGGQAQSSADFAQFRRGRIGHFGLVSGAGA
jgi:hypothetical protein